MRRHTGNAGGDPKARRRAGELESEVLAALWGARRPLTPAEVQAALPGGLSYSTVVTILSRLHEKRVLARARQGRAYAYTPISDEPGLAARRMRKVLDSEQDRGAVLARFVSELTATDEGLLLSLLGPEVRGEPGNREGTE